MKKSTAITGLLAITFVAFSVGIASAQQQSANTSAEIQAGGLGTGINSMVRSILNDGAARPPMPAAQPSAQSMMMSAEAVLDMPVEAEARSMKAETMNASFAMEATVQTEDDVRELIRSLLENDSNLQAIEASDSHVRLTYRVKGSVLKFIKVTMPVTGEAYVSGDTTVLYPWYATRAGVKSDIRTRFDSRLSPHIESGSLSAANRIQLISEMHTFFTEEFASNN